MGGILRCMKRIATATTLVFLSTTALADAVAEVRCLEIGFSKAAESRDLEAFAAFLDEDARFVSRSVMRGAAEITAAWQVFFAEDGPAIRWRPAFVEVLDDGSLALTRGPYRVISRDEDGATVEQWGTFNSVWRRQDDGSWRVVFDAGSPAAGEPDADSRAILEADDDC